MEMLYPYRQKLESIVEESKLDRTPFTRTFRMKQTYLGRIPKGFIDIFNKISDTYQLRSI